MESCPDGDFQADVETPDLGEDDGTKGAVSSGCAMTNKSPAEFKTWKAGQEKQRLHLFFSCHQNGWDRDQWCLCGPEYQYQDLRAATPIIMRTDRGHSNVVTSLA